MGPLRAWSHWMLLRVSVGLAKHGQWFVDGETHDSCRIEEECLG